jgi:ribose 5-phosphate isomerase B
MKVACGSDHAGFKLRQVIQSHLLTKGIEVIDKGCPNGDRVDYPDYGAAVGQAVASGEADLGICTCGSGIGISIAANKVFFQARRALQS